MKGDDPRASDVTSDVTGDVAAEARAPADPAAEHPLVTVDVVILTMRKRRLEALLIKRKRWPYEGLRAIPGGFVGPDESLEDAARRVLEHQAVARDVYLEQLYTFGDPHRDPRARVITVVYYALIRADALHVALASPSAPNGSGGANRPGDDATESAWFPVDALPPMAFDHADILHYTMQRLRGKLEYTDIGYQLLAPEFTLSELQEVYEAILSPRTLDKRNFRKKVLSTGILEPTTHTRKSGQHRPAALYRFSPRAERGA
ncbi:MAG TPA: NUDIX domain-containing protein [Ktedonobacterales bacterium]